MTTAIEQIVVGYVRLKDRRTLEQLRAHRQSLVIDLNKVRSDSSFDLSRPIRNLVEDIAAIDAGIEQLEA
jgi:hypothetical protein